MNNSGFRNVVRILLAISTVISLYFVPWILVKVWITPLPDSIQKQVEEALEYGFDGIVVYTHQKGADPGYYAAGWHDRKNKIPAYPQSLFKIASIGKLYQAVAATKLIAAKQLSLKKTLADYLPSLRNQIEFADEITLEMLVQHRSGIPNFTDTYNYWANPPETDSEKLELILNQPANFKPGSDYQYCNTNYLLLATILDTVLGYNHNQYIQQKILDPLQLKNTYFSLQDINLQELMSGYYVGIEADLKTDHSGSMIASAEDVGIFVRALNEGTLLDPHESTLYASLYKYNHTGLIPGYQSIACYNKDLDLVLVQFTNTTDFQGYNWNLSEIILNRIEQIIKKGAKSQ